MSYPGESFVLGGSNSRLGTSDWESRTTGVIRAYDTGVTENSYQALRWVLTITSAES